MTVVGVSRDSPYSHLRWAEELGLTFQLLSDWNGDAVDGFGIAQTLDGLERTPVRSCFLVDAAAKVLRVWRYGDDEEPDVDALLDAAATTGGG